MIDSTVSILSLIKWTGTAVGGLFISFLGFLAKNHIDNIKKNEKLLNTVIHEISNLNADVVHLKNNVKTGFSGHEKLLGDIIELEKQNIRFENRIQNLENGHK